MPRAKYTIDPSRINFAVLKFDTVPPRYEAMELTVEEIYKLRNAMILGLHATIAEAQKIAKILNENSPDNINKIYLQNGFKPKEKK